MAVSTVGSINKHSKKAKITQIVGDEDSASISHLRREISPDIRKLSDYNHVNKNVVNQLYGLRRKHGFSEKTLRYFKKNFQYLIKQKKGNAQGISQGLDALWRHPFDDHSMCGDWCCHGDATEKTTNFKSLPYGKALTNDALQADLRQLFGQFKGQAEKLASLSSTQANESFNNMVTCKAPKRLFYAGSDSLDFRIAATVSQKNMGHSYITEV